MKRAGIVLNEPKKSQTEGKDEVDPGPDVGIADNRARKKQPRIVAMKITDMPEAPTDDFVQTSVPEKRTQDPWLDERMVPSMPPPQSLLSLEER